MCKTKNISGQELGHVVECKWKKVTNNPEMLHLEFDKVENRIQTSLLEEIYRTKNSPSTELRHDVEWKSRRVLQVWKMNALEIP
jgi:hypothetical protein